MKNREPERVARSELPKRQPGDGPAGAQRIGETLRVDVNEQSLHGLSDYQCARLVVVLCVMNGWTIPRELRKLPM